MKGDNHRNHFYALFPREFFRAIAPNGKKLNMGARVLFGCLLSYRNLKRICPSQQTLADQIDVSRPMVSRYLKKLKQADLIITRKEGRTCIYEFTDTVYNSISNCKQSSTQESNKRNKVEKVYKTSFSKSKSLSTKDKIDQYNEFDF